MWYLRRFFFVAPFATTIQLLRYFNPNRSLVICLLSSLYYPSFLIPIPLEHCPTQKSTKYNESLRNTWVKRRLVLHKTTARFTQNDGSFYTKQRLVLPKTTARFTQNNGSFYTKQRLVLHKTTARFTKNNGLFVVLSLKGTTLQQLKKNVKSSTIPPLARTRTRT